jgi:hypothetical protein
LEAVSPTFFYSLETGRPGFAMVGLHGAEPPAVAVAYDFSTFETVVDVGGASGNMLGLYLRDIQSLKVFCSIGRT